VKAAISSAGLSGKLF